MVATPRVFISYVQENFDTVARLVADLRTQGVEVWFDHDALTPGVFWRDEIRRAVRNHDYFIACFSVEYTARNRTYMNEELQEAVEEIRLRGSTPWFIPVLLSGEVPDISIGAGRSLRDIQNVDLAPDRWNDAVTGIALAILTPRGTTRDISVSQGHSSAASVNPSAERYLQDRAHEQQLAAARAKFRSAFLPALASLRGNEVDPFHVIRENRAVHDVAMLEYSYYLTGWSERIAYGAACEEFRRIRETTRPAIQKFYEGQTAGSSTDSDAETLAASIERLLSFAPL